MAPKLIVRALVAVLLFVPVVQAAEDLSGKWAGSFIFSDTGGPPQEDTAQMVAKHAGAELTGTIGPDADHQWPILKGKVDVVKEESKDVTKVTFDVAVDGGQGPVLHFELALRDGHLKGTAKASQDGRTLEAKIDLGRTK